MRMSCAVVARVAVAAAAIGLPSSAAAQPGRSDVQEGNRLYREAH